MRILGSLVTWRKPNLVYPGDYGIVIKTMGKSARVKFFPQHPGAMAFTHDIPQEALKPCPSAVAARLRKDECLKQAQ